MKKMIVRTDPYPFGLIVPMETGIIWEHQCDGYSCNQIQQEGIFIPLDERYFSSYFNDLEDKEWYYEEEKLPFKFKDITLDVDLKSIMSIFMHEAYDWIIFEGWKDKTDFMAKKYDNLTGKKLLLIYPNSD